MKKTLMILGGVFLVLVVSLIVGFAILAHKGSTYDKESKQYADNAILAVVSNWDKQEILKRASPEFMNAVKTDDLEKLMNMFQRLGKMKKYNGSEGQSYMSMFTSKGKVISAAYLAKADFESGPAEIQIKLVKHGDKWQILGFHINSKAFLQ